MTSRDNGMEPSGPGKGSDRSRGALAVMVILMAVHIALHTVVSGWGTLPATAPGDEPLKVGILHNATDCFSYASWAQQTRAGRILFDDLYTTTPHPPLLLSSYFLIVGKFADLFSTTPLLVMNLLALVCIPVFVTALDRIGKQLRFDTTTRFLVLCLALGGGGVSWLRALAYRAGVGASLHVGVQGPDLMYYDLFPAAAFVVYPYHAFSLALIAVLGLLLCNLDDATRRLTPGHILGLLTVSMLLASSRPYEPLTLLCTYAALTGVSFLVKLEPEQRRRRLQLMGLLAAAMMPFSAYALWTSSQPVWKTFAGASLNLHGNMDWFGAFLLAWLLAATAIITGGANIIRGHAGFFAIWALFGGSIMLVAASGLTKFCGGITLPLAIVGGFTLQRLQSCAPRPRLLAMTAVIAVALGSPLLAYARFAIHPVRIPGELASAVSAVRSHIKSPLPVVLCDVKTGEMLPGLAGMRVYCGHWSLTDDYAGKSTMLEESGFSSPPKRPDPLTLSEKGLKKELAAQLRSNLFDALILRKDSPMDSKLSANGTIPALHDGTWYRAWEMSPKMAAQLADILDPPTSRP